MNFSRAQEAVATEELNLDVAKEAYAQVHSSKKKKAKVNKGEAALADSEPLALAKADHKKAMQAIATIKLAITTEGAKAFELYANLLSNKA